MLIRAEISWTAKHPKVAKVTDHSSVNPKLAPAATEVVTVPGPINAAEITDQRITLERAEGVFFMRGKQK